MPGGDPLLRLRVRVEAQRSRVDAVTLARGSGAVVEDVSLVSPTYGAVNLRALHKKEAAILFGLDVVLVHRLVEARPTRAGVELRPGVEERRAAANAAV